MHEEMDARVNNDECTRGVAQELLELLDQLELTHAARQSDAPDQTMVTPSAIRSVLLEITREDEPQQVREQPSERDMSFRMRWSPLELYFWIQHTIHRSELSNIPWDRSVEFMIHIEQRISEICTDPQEETLVIESSTPVPISAVNTVPAPSIIAHSPFLRLPPETICDLITQALNHDHNAAFKISHVSSYLRAVVLAAPFLWTTVDIMYGLQRSEAHLERSRTMPLTIRAMLRPCPSLPSSSQYQSRIAEGGTQLVAFAKLLTPHRARFQSLFLANAEPEWAAASMATLVPLVEGTVKALDIGLLNNLDTTVRLRKIPEKRHHVESLSFRRIEVLKLSRFCSNFTTRLELVDCAGMEVNFFQNALCAMESSLVTLILRHSRFKRTGDAHRRDPRNAGMTLSSLKTLKLLFVSPEEGRVLLGLAKLPVLTSLSITLSDAAGILPDYGTGKYLLAALLNSGIGDHLRTLELMYVWPWLKDGWILRFNFLHALETFVVRSSSLVNGQLISLANPSVFPALKELVLENEDNLTSAAMRKVVLARVGTLERVVMRGWDDDNVTEDDLCVMNANLEKLEVEVFGGCGSESEAKTEDELDGDDWLSDDY